MAVQAAPPQQQQLQQVEEDDQVGPQPVTKLEVRQARHEMNICSTLSTTEPWNQRQRRQEAERGRLSHGGVHCLCTEESSGDDKGDQ